MQYHAKIDEIVDKMLTEMQTELITKVRLMFCSYFNSKAFSLYMVEFNEFEWIDHYDLNSLPFEMKKVGENIYFDNTRHFMRRGALHTNQ